MDNIHEVNTALNQYARLVNRTAFDLWSELMNAYRDVPLMDFAESDIRQARDMLDRILERNQRFK